MSALRHLPLVVFDLSRRFCSNERITPAYAIRPIVAKLLEKRKKMLLISGIGLIAKTLFPPSAEHSTNRQKGCSIYKIRMSMPKKSQPQQLIAGVIKIAESAAPNQR